MGTSSLLGAKFSRQVDDDDQWFDNEIGRGSLLAIKSIYCLKTTLNLFIIRTKQTSR